MNQRTLFLIRSEEIGWDNLRSTLAMLPEVQIVGDVTEAQRAIEGAATRQPDVIFAATTIEGTSALPLIADLRGITPRSRIVLFAARLDAAEVVALGRLGIAGHLLWSDLCMRTLPHLLALIAGGKVIVSGPAVAEAFLEATWQTAIPRQESVSLTPRERAVLRRLAEGMTHDQIALAEHISSRTVERAVAGLMRKLDASSPFALALHATRRGLLR